MTYLAIALGAFCLYLIWQNQRLQSEQALERQTHRNELRHLMQRIQAPQLAVAQQLAEEADGQEHHAAADGSPHEDEQWNRFIEDGLLERGVELDG